MTNSSISKAALLAATLALAACGSDDTPDYPKYDKSDSVAAANANVKTAEAKAAEVKAKAAEVQADVSADIDAAKAKLDAGMEAAAEKAGVAKDSMSEKSNDLLATAKAKMEEAKEAANQAVESTKEAAAEAVDKTKAVADSAMENAKIAAAKASAAANAAGDKIADSTNRMVNDAKNMADSARENTEAAGDKVMDSTAKAAARTKAAMSGEVTLNNDKDKFSYAIGAEIAKSLDGMGDELDSEVVLAAMKQILDGGKSQLSEEEVQAIRQQAMVRMQQKRAEQAEIAAAENTTASAEFLATAKAKEGVQATESGLLYRIENAGEGEAPAATDRVEVHYRGTLPDGTEFDSSYSRGQPATFALNQVIAGWTEGLQLLKPGGKARFWIPADLAYGERGAGDKIGPNQALVFDVELLAVKEKK